MRSSSPWFLLLGTNQPRLREALNILIGEPLPAPHIVDLDSDFQESTSGIQRCLIIQFRKILKRFVQHHLISLPVLGSRFQPFHLWRLKVDADVQSLQEWRRAPCIDFATTSCYLDSCHSLPGAFFSFCGDTTGLHNRTRQ
jgi:hypothetical protein